MSATLLLITIPGSHFCEKARWSLQRAGLAFHEEQHAPGFAGVAARRNGGSSTVPLLLGPTGVLRASTEIVRLADLQVPQHLRLFPGDPEVDRLVARFDDLLAPTARRVRYGALLQNPRAFLDSLGPNVPRLERWTFRLFRPLVVAAMRRRVGLTEASVAEARDALSRLTDEVAGLLSDGRRYLGGDRFTAADLTFASLLTPVLAPPQFGGHLPDPALASPAWSSELAHWRAHPAGAFAMRLFAEERRSIIGVEG